MNFEQLRAEQPDYKTQDVYFADVDGFVWWVFGATETAILVERCHYRDGKLMREPLRTMSYEHFGQWVDRGDVIPADDGATFTTKPEPAGTAANDISVRCITYRLDGYRVDSLETVTAGQISFAHSIRGILTGAGNVYPPHVREDCLSDCRAVLDLCRAGF